MHNWSQSQIACPPESFFMANYVAILDDTLCAGAWKSWNDERKQRAVDLFGPEVLEDRYRHFGDENG